MGVGWRGSASAQPAPAVVHLGYFLTRKTCPFLISTVKDLWHVLHQGLKLPDPAEKPCAYVPVLPQCGQTIVA